MKYSSIFMIISMSLTLNAFATSSSWKEEALLNDGSKLIVTRSATRGGRHELFQQPSFYSQSLSFIHPNTNQQVTWTDDFSEDIGGANFLPIMLEIKNESTYLVARPLGCLSYNKWDRPNPPYVVFRFVNDWKQIALSELPEEFKTPNLIESSPDTTAEKSGENVVSARTIKNLRDTSLWQSSKEILREPIPDGEVKGCRVLVRYKCGWGEPGEISRKFFENRCK